MSRRLYVLWIYPVVLGMLSSLSVRAQNLVVNGSFETPVATDPFYDPLFPGSYLEGWTIVQGSIDLCTSQQWQPGEGSQSVDMTGTPGAGTIYQNIPTQPGQTYRLRFAIAPSPVAYTYQIQVSWNGTPISTVTRTGFDGLGPPYAMDWEDIEVSNLLATSTTSRLTFQSINTPSPYQGMVLDNVRVEHIISSTVSGRITLQGAIDQAQPVTFEFRPTDGSASFTRNVTLNSNRTYSLSGLPLKEYTVWVKGTKWLAKTMAVDARNGNVSNVNTTLPGGDANNDNSVDALDLAELITVFNTEEGDGLYNPIADFNTDGFVDALDLAYLVDNFNTEGEP